MTTVELPTRELARLIGVCMREARQALGLTQQQVADRSGIARSNVVRMETGQHVQRIDLIVRYATALDCCPCRLLAPICTDAP